MRWLLVILVVSSTARAQVANNSIHQRLELMPDHAIHSTTAGSTVEWSCISKSLTNKCLVYHNDQWFSFAAPKAGTWYLNIASQKCRDEQGVQMIVIEGNPCEVRTYKILHCIPKIGRENTYVKLDSLKEGMTYLVNVDGFLGDVCEFDIALSEWPKGMPRVAETLDVITTDIRREDHIVKFGWTVDNLYKDALKGFRVFRNVDNEPAIEVAELGANLNALGSANRQYVLQDTLQEYGAYRYQIFGVKDDQQLVLLASRFVTFSAPFKVAPAGTISYNSAVTLDLTENAPFRLVIYDRSTGKKLQTISEVFKVQKHRTIDIDFRQWVEEGVREFQVLVIEDDTPTPVEYYFRWNGVREIVKE